MTTAYNSAFPANISITHEIWTNTGTFDNHNDPVYTYGPPIPRQAIAVYPLHRLPHHDIISSEYQARTMIDFVMEVPDASLYTKNDRVTYNGMSFLVQGYPFNWSTNNPFGVDSTMFGGSVHIERVT